MPEHFLKQALQAVKPFRWIRNTEHQITGVIVRLKLFLNNESFVSVYYNANTGSTSYAYVENNERLFGANNMRIGWHIHPWGQEERHIASEVITIEQFLKRLQTALKDQGKL